MGKHWRSENRREQTSMSSVFQTDLNDDGLDTDRFKPADDDDSSASVADDMASMFQQQETPDAAYFECGWCGFAHPKERTVRAHITREDDEDHKNKNAFLDDIFVQVYDEEGNRIGEMRSPKTMSLSDDVSTEYLPRSVRGDKSAQILLHAIADPNMSPSDIAKEIYGDPMSGNLSYVSTVIDRHLSAEAATKGDQPLTADTRRGMTASPEETDEAEEDEASTTQMASEDKSYDDLKPKQKVIVNEYVRSEVDGLDRSRTELEALANASSGHANRTLEKYEHIIDERMDQYEAGELELPDPEDILPEEEQESKSYDELTPRQQRVIDYLVLYHETDSAPDGDNWTKTKVENLAFVSPGVNARIARQHSDVLEARREAYREGILTEDHLNTPPADAVYENTSLPEDEWQKLPPSEQPTGVSLDDIEGGADVEPEPEPEPETPTEELEPVPAPTSATTDVDAVTRDELDALQSSLADQLSNLSERVGALEQAQTAQDRDIGTDADDVNELAARVNALEEQVTTLTSGIETETDTGSAITAQMTEADGEKAVVLESDQWTTVIKALSNYLPKDENDVIHDIVVQA